MIEFYDDPAQMEPLVIDSSRPVYNSLIGLAHELSMKLKQRADSLAACARQRERAKSKSAVLRSST